MLRFLSACVLLCLLGACTRQLDSNEVLPAAATAPPSIEEVSRIELQLRLPVDDIRAALDDALPRSEEIDEHIKLRVPLLRDPSIPVHGNIDRGPLALIAQMPALAFGCDLSGKGSAPVRWMVKGRVNGSLRPTLDAALRLRSNIQAQADVEQAELKLDHLPNVSLRGLIEKRFADAQTRWAERLDRKLNERLDLHARAAKLWDSAHGSVPLPTKRYGDYGLALVHRPTHLLIANPVTTAKGDLVFGIGLEGTLRLSVAENAATDAKADSNAARAMPAAMIVPAVGNRFSLRLPVAVDITRLGEALEAEMGKGRIQLEKKKVRVRHIAAGSDGQRLVLRLGVEAGPIWRRIEGDVFLSAEPVLDSATRELQLRDLRYTLASRNMLLHAASWMASDQMLAELQQRARLPLDALESQGMEAAQKFAQRLSERSEGLAKIEVQHVTLDSLKLVPGYAIALAVADGTVHVDAAALIRDKALSRNRADDSKSKPRQREK